MSLLRRSKIVVAVLSAGILLGFSSGPLFARRSSEQRPRAVTWTSCG